MSEHRPPRASEVTRDVLLLALLWVGAVAVVGPLGDFPLNDDWSYGLAVRRLVEEGRFRPTGWTAMTLVSQVFWGALFCLPAGFSFTAIRISTLVLSLVGTWAVYFLVLHLRRPRWLAVVVALTLAFNTIYFALSHTFMTDVPFTVMITLAVLFFSMGLRSGADRWLLLGTCLSTVAILCRQIGLFLPAAFGLTLLVRRGLGLRWLGRAALPFAVGLGALLAFNAWLGAADVRPAQYSPPISEVRVPKIPLSSVVTQASSALLYLGLFLLPVLMIFRPKDGPGASGRVRAARAIGAVFGLCAACGLVILGRTMPLMRFSSEGNILDPAGIGPLTLRDAFFLKLPHLHPLPSWLWLAVTAASIVGGGLLVTRLVLIAASLVPRRKAGPADGGDVETFFLVAAATLYSLPIVLAPGAFDRYLLPLLPLTCGAIAASGQEAWPRNHPRTRAALVLLGAFSVFSVTVTRDYLTWNRTRWQALWALTAEQQVSPSSIDGGFEFNGLHLYRPTRSRGDRSKSWWWVEDDEYVIAFGEIPGYRTAAKHGFSRWMPPGEAYIHVLRRAATPVGGPAERH